MDAQQSWDSLASAYRDGDLEEAASQAQRLIGWLDEGNSPPETVIDMSFGMGDPWDEAVTRAVCNLILSMQQNAPGA